MEISILFLPLIASIISGFFGKYIGDRNSEIVTSTLVSISAFFSIFILSLVNTQISEATLIAFFATYSADRLVSIKTFAEANA